MAVRAAFKYDLRSARNPNRQRGLPGWVQNGPRIGEKTRRAVRPSPIPGVAPAIARAGRHWPGEHQVSCSTGRRLDLFGADQMGRGGLSQGVVNSISYGPGAEGLQISSLYLLLLRLSLR